jgi:hypothetical protein
MYFAGYFNEIITALGKGDANLPLVDIGRAELATGGPAKLLFRKMHEQMKFTFVLPRVET